MVAKEKKEVKSDEVILAKAGIKNSESSQISTDKSEKKPVKKAPSTPLRTSKVEKDTMASLLEAAGNEIIPYKEGEIVESKVISVSRSKIWVDVKGLSLGYVPEKEITLNSEVKVGDTILAYVIMLEDDDGNVVLSLKRADRERYWKDMEEHAKTGEPVEITINEANKGGLISEIGGIPGFVPVSQLSPEHYPRVSGGDKDEILSRLNQLIGEKILVKVLNCDKNTNKLIFSEKAVDAEKLANKIEKYKVGDIVEGRISGIVDFGLFVKIDPLVEGLVHISEISWSRVTDLDKIYKVGDTIKVMIIAVDDGRLSLSVKRLLSDPWVKAAKKYKVGDIVDGEVTKISPFGAFVSLDEEIDGLVHVSELSDDHIIDPGQIVELGKNYKFKIISIEPDTHRLGLSLKAAGKNSKKDEKEENEKTVATAVGEVPLQAGKVKVEKKVVKKAKADKKNKEE